MAFFSVAVSLLGKGSFYVSEVDVRGIFLRTDAVVSQGLAIDYSLLNVFGMIASFADACVVVCGVFFLHILVCRVPSKLWIVVSRKLILA